MGLSKLTPFLSGVKLWLWLAPTLVLLLSGWSWYLHSSGHQKGYEKAELECAAAREAGKDEALTEILRLQIEAAERQKEMIALNNSINKEVRKERDNITERVETIVREQPIIVDPESCRRGYGVVELWNELSRAGSASSGDTASGSENPSE